MQEREKIRGMQGTQGAPKAEGIPGAQETSGRQRTQERQELQGRMQGKAKRIFKDPKNMVIAVLAAALIFSLGRLMVASAANNAAPGSSGDPLVTRSYVDQKDKALQQALEEKIRALEEKNGALEKRLAELEKKIGSLPAGGGSSGGSSSGSGGSSSGSESSQKVYVKAGCSRINVRSAPSLQASILTKCYPTQVMTLLGTQGEWFNVRMPDGKVGWVHNSVAEVR